jgi:hypothetical protein
LAGVVFLLDPELQMLQHRENYEKRENVDGSFLTTDNDSKSTPLKKGYHELKVTVDAYRQGCGRVHRVQVNVV